MDISDTDTLIHDLSTLTRRFGVTIPDLLLAEYGLSPSDAFLDAASTQHGEALQRFMVAASAYLKFQQDPLGTTYNMFVGCRAVALIRVLARSIRRLELAVAVGLEERLNRLICASSSGEFESVAFEIFVAAAYANFPLVRELEFVPEDVTTKTPDLRVKVLGGDLWVECKRYRREADAQHYLETLVAEPVQALLSVCAGTGRSLGVNLTIEADPESIATKDVAEAGRMAIRQSRAVRERGRFTVEPFDIAPPDLRNYRVYRAPQYLKDQYDYALGERWQGIELDIDGEFRGGIWIDEVRRENCVKWAITNPNRLERASQINYKRVFEGLEQLKAHGLRTALHLCYERGRFGHRKTALDRLRAKLESDGKAFGRVQFHELVVGVSYEGRFDFTEHCHWIAGRGRRYTPDIAQTVFTGDEDRKHGHAEWGVGTLLPDIDLEGHES